MKIATREQTKQTPKWRNICDGFCVATCLITTSGLWAEICKFIQTLLTPDVGLCYVVSAIPIVWCYYFSNRILTKILALIYYFRFAGRHLGQKRVNDYNLQ